ncbi:MAG TPA: hypothetical protein VHI13_08235 [Candidatus Kapabacteria bacterium]|nr:hypothetical protein [Candidatus Kapabacteria bacterium]
MAAFVLFPANATTHGACILYRVSVMVRIHHLVMLFITFACHASLRCQPIQNGGGGNVRGGAVPVPRSHGSDPLLHGGDSAASAHATAIDRPPHALPGREAGRTRRVSGIAADEAPPVPAVARAAGGCPNPNNWNIWYFGFNAGLDFNSGNPVALDDGALATEEGVATMCDDDGSLLFYTDGVTIWNRMHAVMLNGTSIGGSQGSTQSAMIVPLPGSRSQYYLFTPSDWLNTSPVLSYSIVDMKLDGGLGGVTAKNITLHDSVAEQVAAVMHGNCGDIWIVTHGMFNNSFLAFRLTRAGLQTSPVISAIGPFSAGAGNIFGCLKFSRDGKRLCCLRGNNAVDPTVVVYDFDNHTGIVSNPIVLADHDEIRNAYSMEFSPSGRYLYVSNLLSENLYQYDLAAPNAAAIRASKRTVVGTSSEMSCLQLGPDDRIYITSRYTPFLSVINAPDQPEPACGFQQNSIGLHGRNAGRGLPCVIAGYYSRGVVINGPRSSCLADSLVTCSATMSTCSRAGLTWRVAGNGEIVSAADTVVTVRLKDTSGVWVILEAVDNCGRLTDSILIARSGARIDLGADTTLCSGTSLTLDAGPGFAGYRWQDGTPTETYQAGGPGIYWVEVTTSGGCIARDTIQVFPGDTNAAVNLGPDTTLCSGSVITLDAGAGFASYRWQDGSTGRSLAAVQPGKYWVEVHGRCGSSSSDTVVIAAGSPVISLGSDTSVCGAVDMLLDAGAGFSSYEWQDGSTGRTYHATAPGLYTVHAHTGACDVAASIRITATLPVSGASVLAETPAAEIAPGSTVAVPLLLTVTGGRDSLIGHAYRAVVRFNRTLLLPTGDTPVGTIQGNDRVITVTGVVGASDLLAQMQFIVLLGDSERTAVAVDSFQVAGTCGIDATLQGGSIGVATCRSGGTRLLASAARARLAVREGDAAGRSAVIDYTVMERGATRLTLVNALGERMRVLADGSSNPGDYTLTLDASGMAAGPYFLLLETPTEALVEKFMVWK